MKCKFRRVCIALLTMVLMLSLNMTVLATDGTEDFQCQPGCTLAGTEHTECVVASPQPEPEPLVCKEGCTLAGTEHTECVVASPQPEPEPFVCKEGCTLAGTEHTECVVASPQPEPEPFVCKEGCTLAGTEHTECVVEPTQPEPEPFVCKEGCTLAGTEHTECVVEPSQPEPEPFVCKEGCTLVGTEHTECVVQRKIKALPPPFVCQDGCKLAGTDHTECIVNVAKIGEAEYETLKAAVEAANAATKAVIQMMKDIILGEKLTITGDVTIEGEQTITRATDYTGGFFVVAPGATLTLDGGLTIDGGNNWTMDKDAYQADLEAQKQVLKADCEKYFTLNDGAPIAKEYMITTSGGTVNLNDVTIQNNYSTNSGVVWAGANSTVTLKGAHIIHMANTQNSGLVVNADGANINVTVEDGTVIEGNHIGGNHGLFKIYSGAAMTMNGGEIKNTTGWNSNGSVIGLYGGKLILNDGLICSNSSLWGNDNQRNCAVYPHAGSTMIMNGGTICHNTGKDYAGGIGCYKSSATITINGGNVLDNISLNNGDLGDDVQVVGTVSFTGGNFTQDVRQWLADNHHLYYCPDTGIYTVSKTEDDSLAKDGYGVIDVEDEDNFHIIAKMTEVGFDANGGNGAGIGSKSVFVGYAYGDLPVPTRTGYTFGGWKLGDKLITADTVVEAEDAHTLVAQWTANQYTITFMDENGVYKTLTGNYGEKIKMPEVPKKDGYTVSWETAPDTITEDMTIKAIYTPNAVEASGTVPKTGEDGQLGLWLTLFGSSVVAMGMLLGKRKTKA